jgi:transposase
VYWIPLYDILEERGFEVYLVNARHTKNLPGRKSDVQECQWLLKLHTYGLLNNSFQPTSEIRVLRTYWRQRAEHVQGAASCIQRMQKALTQMNVQLANVLSDLSGLTGQLIVRAIVAGERSPQKLAELWGHCEESGGKLATRARVFGATGSRYVRHLPEAHCGV